MSSPQSTFIVPVLNESAGIANLLRDLRQRFPQSELVVVDGGSEDETVATAMPLCDQLLIGERGRAAQMNLGGRAASGRYLLFLHADSVPGMDEQQLYALLEQSPRWGFCRLRLGSERRCFRLIEWFINQRSRLTSIGTGDQMLFVERELFRQTGGFDALLLMEDVAYCKRLRAVCQPVLVPQAVVTSSRRWEEGGVVSTVLRMWCLRFAYFLGVSPNYLWRHYYGR